MYKMSMYIIKLTFSKTLSLKLSSDMETRERQKLQNNIPVRLQFPTFDFKFLHI